MAIARHRARRVRRTAAASRLTSLDDVPLLDLGLGAGWGCDGPDVAFERAEDVEQLARALASLEAPDREVLVLRDVEMLSGDETAKVLGIGLAAVKSRLHRARLRLLGALRSSEGSVVERERSVGGLRCSEVLAHLGEYVDGELGGDGRARIDAHLLECSVCERFGGRYARVVHGARVRLGADTTFDDRVADAIRHRLEQG